MPSPITNALNEIIKASDLASQARVFDYHEDFDDLWGQLHEDSPQTSQAIVIHGLDAPHRPLPEGLAWEPFAKHLTAFSWAAAWRVRHADHDSPRRVLLVGDTQHGPETTAGKLAALYHTKTETGSPLVPGIRWLPDPARDQVEAWLKTPPPISASPRPDFTHILRDIIWEGLAGDPLDHHGVSNILGAYLLRFQAGSPYDESKGHPSHGQKALFSLLTAISPSPPGTERIALPSSRPDAFQRWISAATQRRLNAAVLLDDMAALWGPVVRGALGFVKSDLRKKLTISAPDFPRTIRTLPSRLDAFFTARRPFLAKSDLLPGGPPKEDSNDFVLILDLRLFTAHGGQDERAFYQDLVALAERLTRPPHLDDKQWQSLTTDAAQVKSLLAAGGPVSEDFRAITLLPRLLSALDSTLPIVLFSSTHKRTLIDPLRAYPNIVTGFVKPVFGPGMANWHSTVERTMDAFGFALEQAATILAARQTARNVFAIAPLRKDSQPKPTLPTSQHGHLVEIFMDESGASERKGHPHTICAGGVVLIRSQDQHAQPTVTDSAIWHALNGSHNLWGWCSSTPPDFPHPTHFLPKGSQLRFNPPQDDGPRLAGALDSLNTALHNTGILFPFALIDVRSRYDTPSWLSIPPTVQPWAAEKAMDMTLKSLIRTCLEALLFRDPLIEAALASPQSTLCIDLGARMYPWKVGNELFANFGIRSFWNDNKQREERPSVEWEDGYRLTAEVCSRTGLPWPHAARISRARAVALTDFASWDALHPSSPMPCQIHYLADTVAHLALHDLEAATHSSPRLADFFRSGWVTDYRKSRFDEHLLFAARQWSQGDRVGALLSLASTIEDVGVSHTDTNGFCAATAPQTRFWWRDLAAHELRDLFARHARR